MRNTFGTLCGAALVAAVVGCSPVGGARSHDGMVTKLGSCSPTPCVAVSLSALPVLPNSIPAQARSSIVTEVKKVLYASLEVEGAEPSRENIVRELEERYKEYGSVSDAEVDWNLKRSASVLFSNPSVTAVEVYNEGYLGGAHGFKERSLMTFDSKTGHRLGVSDVVDESSQATLAKIVEAEFRRARSIRGGQSLQDAGFFVLPGQQLPLGENFALTDNGLEIQYNPYEIAPYSMGETRVQVPREAVEPLVKADLRGVFSSQVDGQKR
jgi:hypothetical protein